MTTHLSTRLVWHDRAWDGHICDHQSKNASCVVQEHIRDGRDDDREDKAAGVHLADLKTWQPPCCRDPIAFSNRGYTISHNDPLEFRQLPSVREEIPPYSVCPSPYRWLREENFRITCEDERLNIREATERSRCVVIAEAGTEAYMQDVPLDDITEQIRFDSPSKDRLTVIDGRINPQQMQMKRCLTGSSSQLIIAKWSAAGQPVL